MEQFGGRLPEAEVKGPDINFAEKFFTGFPELLQIFDNDFQLELAEYWRSAVRDEFDEPLAEEEEQAELHKALQREMGFFVKVYGAGMYMAEHFPGTVTLLFDLDNTLREPGENQARPAFKAAVNLLSEHLGSRMEVGLLTTIRLERLDMERGDFAYLECAGANLNPAFFITSGEYELGYDSGEALSGWDKKGRIVEDLAHKYPERTFVLVDDLKMSQLPTPMNPRVMCVAVTSEIHNDLWRQAAMAA